MFNDANANEKMDVDLLNIFVLLYLNFFFLLHSIQNKLFDLTSTKKEKEKKMFFMKLIYIEHYVALDSRVKINNNVINLLVKVHRK